MFGNQCLFPNWTMGKGGRALPPAFYFSLYARITEKHLLSVPSGESVAYHCVLLYQPIFLFLFVWWWTRDGTLNVCNTRLVPLGRGGERGCKTQTQQYLFTSLAFQGSGLGQYIVLYQFFYSDELCCNLNKKYIVLQKKKVINSHMDQREQNSESQYEKCVNIYTHTYRYSIFVSLFIWIHYLYWNHNKCYS